MLERMVSRECGAEFDDDLFGEDPSETIIRPLCGIVALDHVPVEDRLLHIHAAAPASTPPDVSRPPD